MSRHDAYFPGRPAVDAFGNGGFRFAQMSHIGSLLFLPSGVYGWELQDGAAITLAHLRRVFDEAANIDFLLLGTGVRQVFPAPELSQALADKAVGLEVMDSGAAVGTYNILLAENRDVALAVICVA